MIMILDDYVKMLYSYTIYVGMESLSIFGEFNMFIKESYQNNFIEDVSPSCYNQQSSQTVHFYCNEVGPLCFLQFQDKE